MITYRDIAKTYRKKLDKINIKMRVYGDNTAVDFFYKKHLCITILTEELDEEKLCEYMIKAYNSYTRHKRFGKKDLIITL